MAPLFATVHVVFEVVGFHALRLDDASRRYCCSRPRQRHTSFGVLRILQPSVEVQELDSRLLRQLTSANLESMKCCSAHVAAWISFPDQDGKGDAITLCRNPFKSHASTRPSKRLTADGKPPRVARL